MRRTLLAQAIALALAARGLPGTLSNWVRCG